MADTQQADMASGEAIQPRELSGFPRSQSRSLDFCGAPCGGRAETSVVARGCFQAGKSSSFQRQKADAHGSGHFFALTYASVTVLNSHCSPGGTIDPGFPRVIFSHDRFEHWTKGNRWDRLRGKYLVPRRELRRAKIILLVRDPRDCFVSLYLQMTRRDPSADAALKQKSVSELLRDKRFGIRGIVRAMNDWLDEFSGRKDFTIVRYEAVRASPAEHFRDLLAVVGETTPDMSIFQEALEFSRFENMQKLEAAGVFDSKILHPGDVRDPESFKVRRGKVGGYREYLSAEDLEYAADALRELDPQVWL